jgi:hypothetical protein
MELFFSSFDSFIENVWFDYVFFFSFKNFFSDNTRVRNFFFPVSNIRLYDKNSEDYFFIAPPKSEYFFSNIGNQNIFLEKKT